MSDSEITRIVNRIDSMEQRWNTNMKAHEREIKGEIEKQLKDHRTNMMWMIGLIFSFMFTIIGWIGLSHLETRDEVNTQHEAIRILVGKINDEHPGYVIESLNNQYNPQRGGTTQ